MIHLKAVCSKTSRKNEEKTGVYVPTIGGVRYL